MPVTAVRDEGALRMWVCRLPVHIGPRRMNQLYVPPFGPHQPQLVGAEQSPAPTARLRRAASPSGEVVFYTGAASFFRKKTPARLENTCSICYHWYKCQRADPPFFCCYGTGNVLILSPSSTPGLPRPPRGSPIPLRRPPPQPAPPNTKIPRRIRMYPQIRL